MSAPSPSCAPITAALDAHFASAQRKSNRRRVIAYFGRLSGIGDQVSGLMSALTIAIASRRRLEVAPEPTSYINHAFSLPFDSRYTGDATSVREIDEWVRTTFWPEHWRRMNTSDHVIDLPRVERSSYALTVGINWPHLMSRLVVPSPSGKYAPLHTKLFSRDGEFVMGGNTGSTVFRTYFEHALEASGSSFHDEHFACAVRHVLRPTEEVKAALAAMRPWPPPASAPRAARHVRVGLHIRADAHLINRLKGNDAARHLTLATDRAADSALCGGARREPTAHTVAAFGEYWITARAASGNWSTWTLPAHAVPASVVAAMSMPSVSDRWLLVSDSAELKRAAAAAWPGRLFTTAVRPSHVLCGELGADGAGGAGARRPALPGGERRRLEMVETVAEVLLLGESDALVIGRSRFAYVALLLSKTCRRAFHVTLDRRCRPYATSEGVRRANARYVAARPDETWAARCIGPDGQYSVRSLVDATGALHTPAGRSWKEVQRVPQFIRLF